MASLILEKGSKIGLCDSNGDEFRIGSIVRRHKEINCDTHGKYVDYTITLQGIVPLLTYLISEKGQILPVGHTVYCLSGEYDINQFAFFMDSKKLRPEMELLIQPTQ